MKFKRRDFVKTIPIAALGAAYACSRPETMEVASSFKKPESFRVANPSQKNPGAHDHIHCDQFGIDHEGKPIANNLTGTGSDTGLKEHDPEKPHTMTLTQEEQDILDGKKGPEMAKLMKIQVVFGTFIPR